MHLIFKYTIDKLFFNILLTTWSKLITKIKISFLCLCDSNFAHQKLNVYPQCWLNTLQKHLFSRASLTHSLTHTGKYPYGTSGTRSVKEATDSEQKGLKIPIQRQLKGFGTFRNQQVARSSRVTSSKKSP